MTRASAWLRRLAEDPSASDKKLRKVYEDVYGARPGPGVPERRIRESLLEAVEEAEETMAQKAKRQQRGKNEAAEAVVRAGKTVSEASVFDHRVGALEAAQASLAQAVKNLEHRLLVLEAGPQHVTAKVKPVIPNTNEVEPRVTRDDVRRLMVDVAAARGSDVVFDVLKKFGAGALSEVPAGRDGELHAALLAARGGGK